MNPKPASLWTRPFLPRISPFRFVRWFFRWRNVRRCLFVLACLATLIAIFYAEENWRGHRAWENFKREQEAKGEKFDYQAFIPPPVPDDQNFAMSPIWEEARLHMENVEIHPADTNLINRLAHFHLTFFRSGITGEGPPGYGKPEVPDWGSWQTGSNTDLAAWQNYYRAPVKLRSGELKYPDTNDFPIPAQPGAPAADVLLALGKYSDALDQLRLAARRPLSRFPIHYENGEGMLLYHDSVIKGDALTLHLLVVAELEAGQNQQAAMDLNVLLRMADSLKPEPVLISCLVRAACQQIALGTLWEGMGKRQWTEAQLRDFQEKLESENALADFLQTMKADRALILSLVDELASKRFSSTVTGYYHWKIGNAVEDLLQGNWEKLGYQLHLGLAPRGWFEREKLFFVRTYADAFAAFDPQAGRVDYQRVQAVDDHFTIALGQSPDFDTMLSTEPNEYPGPIKPVQRAIQQQTCLNLGAVACALERYWFANKTYPEKLDALVPQFIAKVPREIVSGEPLKYRRSDDGRFVLYSTGLDGKDSGGVYRKADGKLTGNWVWRYPAK